MTGPVTDQQIIPPPRDAEGTLVDPGARPGRLHTPMQWVRFIARSGKRILVLLAGCCVLGAGVAMLALPGPGLLVIIVGLAILATEFAWAERMLDRAAGSAHAASTKVSSNRRSRLMLLASASALVLGGGAVMVLSSTWRMIGLSMLLAGSIGIATQHPAVERWLAHRSGSRPTDAPDTGTIGSTTPDTDTDTPVTATPATDTEVPS
jgi:uncharacterized protein (TIGR02611 family)